MASDPKLDLLRSIGLFSQLGKKEIERLGQLTEEVDVKPGQVLMRQGDRGHEMFVIASGQVKIERDGRDLGLRGPGEVIGEIALLSEGPRGATVTVVEPTRAFVVSHADFHALMDEMPSVRMCVLDVLAGRLRSIDASHVD
jgi:CRP-like cAMP-binding protein